jgi:DNA-binding NtrC family response regulator
MPARVVVVHDEREFVDEVATALRSAGHEVATFPDPIAAWDALEAARQTEVLLTRVLFQPGKSNGVALARMARTNRPGIRVLFTALPAICIAYGRAGHIHGNAGRCAGCRGSCDMSLEE